MKRIKNYTSIWNVEKMLYSLGDLNLIVPLTFTQIAWLVGTFLVVLMFADIPPFSLISNGLMKYAGIPAGVTWLMSQRAFDGKKPYSFLKSAVCYIVRPKETYGGKAIQVRNSKLNERITVVRSEVFEKISISD